MSGHGVNLLVFRAGHKRVSGAGLKAGLLRALESLTRAADSQSVLGALLRAGELECAIADAEPAGCAHLPFAALTDSLADALLTGEPARSLHTATNTVSHMPVPESVELSRPEGFAYYALHPISYSQVLDKLPAMPEPVVVIGIRSIGTTLSAMTAAAARLRGLTTTRMTVRPGGHPYHRETQFTADQTQVIRDAITRGSGFLVVDEGPGLSGSSFLSVAEALERTGVSPGKITLLCGHEPKPDALCTKNGAHRWRRFRSVSAAQEPRRPAEAVTFVGGGEWRRLSFADSSEWPESWTSMERLKYLSSAEPRRLFKFAGFGHYGDALIEREQAVADAGFGPAPQRESSGFASYPWLAGRPASCRDVSSHVLERLAEYCAFRADTFVANDCDNAGLQEMAEHNLAQFELNLPLSLKLERPVIADGRMQPHEWVSTAAGEMLKTDSGSHGDDHFFPGCTDIAWDLAGAIVEWNMEPRQATVFLNHYRHRSGDDAGPRIEDFVRAYTAFRWAYCTMAANAMAGTGEQARLQAATERYAARLPTCGEPCEFSLSSAR